eukprot:TRINITY_DN14784_c0_g4_i1.p1 TRINITY_DN14784_c0_g4~~TRINITY_DN14784_c0_g4_i1.p1  ORF type:complete len:655 (-),score=156.69 TRINITY_DN14784_c0_g4_i1:205-2169(-)
MGGQCCSSKNEANAWETPLGWRLSGLRQIQEIGFSNKFIDLLEQCAQERKYDRLNSIVRERNASGSVVAEKGVASGVSPSSMREQQEDCIICIMRGSMALYKEGKELGKMKAGQILLSERESPGAVALTPCIVLRIPSEGIRHAEQVIPSEERQVKAFFKALADKQREFLYRHLFAQNALIKSVGFGGAFLDHLAEGLEEKTYRSGLVITDDSCTRTLFAIAEGSVLIRREGREVAGLSAGELFGCVLAQSSASHTKVEWIAAEPVTVLRLGPAELADVHERFQEDANLNRLQEAIERQTHARERVWGTVRRLMQAPNFVSAGLSHAFIGHLAEDIQVRKYEEGQVIVDQGGFDRNLYVLADGVCAEHRDGKDVGSLSAGSVFGAAAALQLHERQASTIAAVAPCTALVISQIALVKALDAFPSQVDSLARLWQQMEAHRVIPDKWNEGLQHPWADTSPKQKKNNDRLNAAEVAGLSSLDRSKAANGNPGSATDGADAALLGSVGRGKSASSDRRFEDAKVLKKAKLSSEFRSALASRAQTKQYSAKSTIMTEGASCGDECLYFLKSGRARVSKSGNEVSQLSAGDVFGAASLDENTKNAFEVTATEACVVEVLSTSDFMAVIDAFPTEVDACVDLSQVLEQRMGRSGSSSGST